MHAPATSLLPLLERAGLGIAICLADGSIATHNRMFDNVLARLGGAYKEGLPIRLPHLLAVALDRNPHKPWMRLGRNPFSRSASPTVTGSPSCLSRT